MLNRIRKLAQTSLLHTILTFLTPLSDSEEYCSVYYNLLLDQNRLNFIDPKLGIYTITSHYTNFTSSKQTPSQTPFERPPYFLRYCFNTVLLC